MTVMTRLDDKNKPIQVDATRYGDLAVSKPEKFDRMPWAVFHVPTGRDVTRALPERLQSKGTKRRDVKAWCMAFQNDGRIKSLWKTLRRGDVELTSDEAGRMIEVGKAIDA